MVMVIFFAMFFFCHIIAFTAAWRGDSEWLRAVRAVDASPPAV
jgi:hypothetical protein